MIFPSVFPAQSAMRKIITENEGGYNLATTLIEVNVTKFIGDAGWTPVT